MFESIKFRTTALMVLAAVCSTVAFAQTVTLTGTVTTTDPTHTPRIFRDGNASVATSPKAFPGTFGSGGFNYDSHTRTNSTASQMLVQCILELTGTPAGQIHATAYLTTFDPANIATNYVADSGSSVTALGVLGGMSFFVPAGGSYVIVLTQITPGSTADYSVNVFESATNTAPVLDNTGASAMSAIAQDVPSASNTGMTVAAIIATGTGGDPITDADAGAVEGIAVVAVDNTNGAWQFSTDTGATWTPFGTLTYTATGDRFGSARVLSDAASNLIRFVPNAAFSGAIAVGFRYLAWDRSIGTSGQTLQYFVEGTGGNLGNVGPFSSAVEDVSITVNAQAAVTVTGVVPASGPTAGGTTITITGTEFGASSTVTVAGTAATSIVVNSSTSITCQTPAGSLGPASVIVTSNGQSNAANTLFTYSNNTAPGITPAAAITRAQGATGTVSTIATVTDAEDAVGTLVVTATTVPTGITITGITNTGGTITANVAASAAATLGANNVTLTVTDSGSLFTTANFVVNVVAATGGGGGGGGGNDGGCSTGDNNNALLMLAGVLASFGLALRLRRKSA